MVCVLFGRSSEYSAPAQFVYDYLRRYIHNLKISGAASTPLIRCPAALFTKYIVPVWARPVLVKFRQRKHLLAVDTFFLLFLHR